MRKCLLSICACVAVLCSQAVHAAQPIPIGIADVTLSYETNSSGLRVLQDQFDYSGTGPGDVAPLDGDPNIGYFNSVNLFGRRPLVPGGIGPDESLLAHAFFKTPNHANDFFNDIAPNQSLTFSVQNMQFANPVFLQTDTVMMHKLWDVDQLDAVDIANSPFLHLQAHNHNTQTDPFRNFADFFPGVFSDFPPNYELGTLPALQVTGNGTTNLGFSVTFPYEIFRHQEEDPQNPLTIPGGLPAPYGFLEPFHFHLELVVSEVPEPATLALLLAAGPLLLRRRRRM